MNFLKGAWNLWDEFWFSPKPLLNLAVFRIILCATLFGMYFSRQFDLEIFYSEKGLLPRDLALQVMPEFYRSPFEWFFWPDSLGFLMHGLMVLGLFLLIFGIGGRALALFVWILQIGFLDRNYALAFGADLIGGIFLLLMVPTDCCERLSVLNLFRKKVPREQSTGFFTSVFYRLIQVQLCVIYVYTGFEKLRGASWWDGTALWSVFANPQMVVADLTWVRHVPLVIPILTFSTVFFEIYFSAFVWIKQTRPYALMAGVLFHFGIGVLMALMSFATVMLAPYALFVPPERLSSWVSFVRLKLRQPATAFRK